jgi:Na+/serine symporter
MTDLEIIDEIEKIRSKNNINWMNVLRLAFKHAPDEARKLVSEINIDDQKISKLLKQLSENT